MNLGRGWFRNSAGAAAASPSSVSSAVDYEGGGVLWWWEYVQYFTGTRSLGTLVFSMQPAPRAEEGGAAAAAAWRGDQSGLRLARMTVEIVAVECCGIPNGVEWKWINSYGDWRERKIEINSIIYKYQSIKMGKQKRNHRKTF